MGDIHRREPFLQENSFVLAIYVTFVLMFLTPLQAKADAAVPTLLFIWPASWILLLAIIPVEYIIAKKILALSHKRSFILSLTANAISSLVGIPIAWLILAFGIVVTSLSIYSTWKNVGSISWYDPLLQVTGSSVFLSPEPIQIYFHQYVWTLPVAILFLLLPYFFASVWIEKLVAQRFVRDKAKAATWSWTANSVTYGLMLIVLGCVSLFSVIHDRSLTFAEGDLGGTSGVDVYAFRAEQIDSMLAKEKVDEKRPEASKFFADLPYSEALAHVKSGPSSGRFYLSLPEHGNFVIASSYKGYEKRGNGQIDERQYFWLIRLQTNGENTIKLKLTPQNMVDSKSPNIIELDTTQ